MKPIIILSLGVIGIFPFNRSSQAATFSIVAKAEETNTWAFLKLAKGFPQKDQQGLLLGICKDRKQADLIRDIARLSAETVQVLEKEEGLKDVCPKITAPRKGAGGYSPMIQPPAKERAVITDAPNVVWRMYARLAELSSTSCVPYKVLARVEAGPYVLGELVIKGECVPRNAKSNFESKELIWLLDEEPVIVHGDRRRIHLARSEFNRDLREHVWILLGFECNRITIVKRWEYRSNFFTPTRMRASGPPPRTWEQLDSVQISGGAGCVKKWEDSCLSPETARRQIWNPKECQYDEVPWNPPPSKEELLKSHAEFQ